MAIAVYASEPKELLDHIRRRIGAGELTSWEVDADGDFCDSQRRGWWRPKLAFGVIQFGLLGTKNVEMTKRVYADCHGRLLSMLLESFDREFTSATVTALPDRVIDKI